MDELEVLLEHQNSKRVIKLGPETDGKEKIRNILGSIDPRIYLVFGCTEEVPGNAAPHILQRYCSEWNDYVDVQKIEEIKHKDKLCMIPQPSRAVSSCNGPSGSNDYSISCTSVS